MLRVHSYFSLSKTWPAAILKGASAKLRLFLWWNKQAWEKKLSSLDCPKDFTFKSPTNLRKPLQMIPQENEDPPI
jgi:hypothetical protein